MRLGLVVSLSPTSQLKSAAISYRMTGLLLIPNLFVKHSFKRSRRGGQNSEVEAEEKTGLTRGLGVDAIGGVLGVCWEVKGQNLSSSPPTPYGKSGLLLTLKNGFPSHLRLKIEVEQKTGHPGGGGGGHFRSSRPRAEVRGREPPELDIGSNKSSFSDLGSGGGVVEQTKGVGVGRWIGGVDCTPYAPDTIDPPIARGTRMFPMRHLPLPLSPPQGLRRFLESRLARGAYRRQTPIARTLKGLFPIAAPLQVATTNAGFPEWCCLMIPGHRKSGIT
ncbi:hypothetical protein BDK51DRAFT_47894 [Blyttiomyces helicus]|uniref:Uncharacterized protein n=1 Tax=Blyttiomyces helicus TaxID=388810 RepID=A0A4P9WAH0_9FUNG|nr:hypothetical protein BDK51DRAFT_47894 [Blyttiomyces helicus]|eukprot:RKO88148.1 hypothetical protein BDK51DRAFT_47894 [Blyttiomyces helicus]